MRIYVTDHRCTQNWDGVHFEADVEFWPEHTNDIFEYEKLMRDCGRGAFEMDRFRKLFNIKPRESTLPSIKNIYFNPPATVVLWDDGTKTVVKCQDSDTYSKEVGLSLCIAKKALGNKGNYNDIFKKWIPEEKPAHRSLDEWDKMENTSDKLYRCAKEACAPKVKRGCGTCKFVRTNVLNEPCYSCDLSYSEWTPVR